MRLPTTVLHTVLSAEYPIFSISGILYNMWSPYEYIFKWHLPESTVSIRRVLFILLTSIFHKVGSQERQKQEEEEERKAHARLVSWFSSTSNVTRRSRRRCARSASSSLSCSVSSVNILRGAVMRRESSSLRRSFSVSIFWTLSRVT